MGDLDRKEPGEEVFTSLSEEFMSMQKRGRLRSVLGKLTIERPNPEAERAKQFLREQLHSFGEGQQGLSDELMRMYALTLYAQLAIECGMHDYQCFVRDETPDINKEWLGISRDQPVVWPGLVEVTLPPDTKFYQRKKNAGDEADRAKDFLRQYFDFAQNPACHISSQKIEDLSITLYAHIVQKCRIEGRRCIILKPQEQDPSGQNPNTNIRELVWPGFLQPLPPQDEDWGDWDWPDDDSPVIPPGPKGSSIVFR